MSKLLNGEATECIKWMRSNLTIIEAAASKLNKNASKAELDRFKAALYSLDGLNKKLLWYVKTGVKS